MVGATSILLLHVYMSTQKRLDNFPEQVCSYLMLPSFLVRRQKGRLHSTPEYAHTIITPAQGLQFKDLSRSKFESFYTAPKKWRTDSQKKDNQTDRRKTTRQTEERQCEKSVNCMTSGTNLKNKTLAKRISEQKNAKCSVTTLIWQGSNFCIFTAFHCSSSSMKSYE